MSTDVKTPATIRFSAMSFLAMREHSVKELRQKLEQRFDDLEQITEVINQLAEDGLQSDERFAEAFVAMRKRQGKGPIRIALELKEKGIEPDLIIHFIDADNACWMELAVAEQRKRFGNTPPGSVKERSRQARFLQYRGFSHAHIKSILR